MTKLNSEELATLVKSQKREMTRMKDELDRQMLEMAAEIERLRSVIQGAMLIESLWMPPDKQNDPNHDEEFAALAIMRQAFKEVLE